MGELREYGPSLHFFDSQWKIGLVNSKNRIANNLQNNGIDLKKMKYLGGPTSRTSTYKYIQDGDNTCGCSGLLSSIFKNINIYGMIKFLFGF